MLLFGGCFWWLYKETGRIDADTSMFFLMLAIPMHTLLSISAIGGISREIAGERRERTLELLLCTPLSERQIVWAKIKGLWLRYGLPYLAATLPAAGFAFWFYFGFNTRNLGNDYGRFNWVLAESLEDVTFCFMLFAVALRFALSSRTATNAILKSVSAVAGMLMAWGFTTLIIGESSSRFGGSGEVWLIIMVFVKIGMELFIAISLLKSLPVRLREQCGMTADAL